MSCSEMYSLSRASKLLSFYYLKTTQAFLSGHFVATHVALSTSRMKADLRIPSYGICGQAFPKFWTESFVTEKPTGSLVHALLGPAPFSGTLANSNAVKGPSIQPAMLSPLMPRPP